MHVRAALPPLTKSDRHDDAWVCMQTLQAIKQAKRCRQANCECRRLSASLDIHTRESIDHTGELRQAPYNCLQSTHSNSVPPNVGNEKTLHVLSALAPHSTVIDTLSNLALPRSS